MVRRLGDYNRTVTKNLLLTLRLLLLLLDKSKTMTETLSQANQN